ncbi:MAG: response regulator [Deltaproteobacteria bacterium]|nr:response regulator [Deltaproteobacteria bacterium]
MNILLVDDHHELRSATRELLEDLGHRVTDVADCVSALEEVSSRGSALDAVVTDIRIPGMSGTDLLEALLAQECDLALVAYSSSGGDERLQKMLLDRRVFFLAKPFSADQLHAKLDRAGLERRRSAAAGVGEFSAPGPVSLPRSRDRSSAASRRPFSDSDRSPASRGSSSLGSPASRERVSRNRFVGLAASVMLALATGLLIYFNLPQAPSLPERSPETLLRGARFELDSPLGELQERPAELVWQRVPKAKKYRIQLLDVEDAVLWEALLETPFRAAGAAKSLGRDFIVMALPLEIASALKPAVVYYWRVEALGEGDATVASSKRERFLMMPDLTSSPSSSSSSRPDPLGGSS